MITAMLRPAKMLFKESDSRTPKASITGTDLSTLNSDARKRAKGFVILTKSFVKIWITKTYCYNNKMFSSVNKTFGCCGKIFGCSNKKIHLLSLILLP